MYREKEKKLIRDLVKKAYNERILKLTKKRLSRIKRITKDYDEEEIEKVFWNEHIERRKLIQQVEATWEEQLKQWMSKEYKGERLILTLETTKNVLDMRLVKKLVSKYLAD